MQHHQKTGTRYDPEDHIATLQTELRRELRTGDPTNLAPSLRAQIASIRDTLWLDFERDFDTARFAAGEDRIAPDVTYTSH